MCGRFALTDDSNKIINTYGLKQSRINLTPRYNIAPSERIPVIIQENGLRLLKIMEWGLIPYWSKKQKPMINARIETVAEKPTFCNALKKSRCLIPANGFFEWTKENSEKQPYFICLKNKSSMAFAGLWEDWISLEGDTKRTFAILTTEANSFVKKIHHRMPIILTQKNFGEWLNFTDTSLKNFISTCNSEQLQAWKVSKKVNISTFDNPKCLKKIPSGKILNDIFLSQKQGSLFD